MTRVIKLGIKRPVTGDLLPDPEPRKVKYTLISTDDHLVEPRGVAQHPPRADRGRAPGRVPDRHPEDLAGDSGRFSVR